MLQFTDPERLSNKDGSCMGLPGKSRIDFAGGLGVGGDGNRRNEVQGGIKGETIRIGNISEVK